MTARIPQLDLARQYHAIRDEILAALERVADSQHYILGEEVEAFEREAGQYLGAAEVAACSSGTDALWLAQAACGVAPGDEVLTTAFSFFATASSVLRAGARPLFVDIEPGTFNLDPAQVRRKLENDRPYKLKAVMPVHLYGQCADMDAFGAIATEFNVAILEDAAQAFGATWRGKCAGTFGAAAAFSFYPTKNIGAAGEAGCVTSNDVEVIEHVRALRNHGSRQRYVHEEVGWNSRMDGFQAAVLRVKLRHLDEWNAQRRHRAATYDRLFAAAGLGSASDSSAPVRLPITHPHAKHVFHQYTIRTQRRDELRAFLQEQGIDTQIYYPVPLHLQPALAFLGYRPGDLPETEAAASEALSLPMFAELTDDEQQAVVSAIADFFS